MRVWDPWDITTTRYCEHRSEWAADSFTHQFTAPCLQLLDGRVMPHASKSPRAVASKICIDQLIFAPICTLVFYAFKVATEGRPRWVGERCGVGCGRTA